MSRGVYDRSKNRKPLPLPIEHFEKEYTDSEETINSLAKKYGCSASILRNRMIEHGFKFRGRGVKRGSGRAAKTGNFDRYPIEAYRDPPCNNENPFCVILRDHFRRKNGEETSPTIIKRLTELWMSVNIDGHAEQKASQEEDGEDF